MPSRGSVGDAYLSFQWHIGVIEINKKSNFVAV